VLDISDLERRWLKYKIKRYAPMGIGILILSVSVLLLLYFWFDTSVPKNISNPSIHSAKVEKMTSIPKAQVVFEENRTILEPSMEFVQSFESAPHLSVPLKSSVQSVAKTTQPIMAAVPTPQVIKVPEISNAIPVAGSASPSSDKSLSINRNESKLDIESLQRRFKDTSNANLGLFIARYYYDQGNFNEAYNYALKTNTLNSKIDESWLIFSKSLVKLGKSDQAKKTLQLYISQSGSETAKALLDAIEKGNFK